MPSMSAHMAVACNLSDELDVDKEEFIKGNLLPDLYDNKEKSHFKVQGIIYYVPDIKKAIENLDLNNSLYLGYLTHLLLDKYYFDEYLIKYKSNLFDNKNIYKDYDILNKDIINYFKLDVDYLKKILKDFPSDINKHKLLKNIECLDININDKTQIIDKEDFILFLENISNIIKDEIESLR